jgi:LCP family protein required for cell wall assembly
MRSRAGPGPAFADRSLVSELDLGAGERVRRRERRPRWQRVLGYLCVVVALLLTAGLIGGKVLYDNLDNGLHREDLSQFTGTLPPRTVVGAQNFLIMGSDSRQGKANQTLGGAGLADAGARSDTTILVHLSRGATSATMVSIPRDSYVQIPACHEPGGGTSTPQMNKFNAAFSIGGPACTIKTVQSLTHIAIDHWVEIDFEGFVNMVNALGGIDVCLSKPIDDPVRKDPATGGYIGSGLIAKAGTDHFDGRQALAFVRSRYAVADGSDLSRIKDQQTFLSAMIRKATSIGLLLDLPKLYSFLKAVVNSLTVDSGLHLTTLVNFAKNVHQLPPSKVKLLTVPLGDTTGYADIGGYQESVVRWAEPAADQLWTALRNDTPLTGSGPKPRPSSSSGPKLTVPPSAITVNVLNATSQNGLAHTVAAKLAALGYTIGQVTDAPSTSATTYVQYGATRAQSAQTLAAAVNSGVPRQADSSLTDSVNLVIGNDYSSVHAVTLSPSSGTPTPSPSSSFDVTNAQSDKCAIG